MAVLFPFVFIPFCVQLVTFGCVKQRYLCWTPIALMEGLLLVGMVCHRINPPSFDILGWKIYLWLMGSVLLGGIIAWGSYALYSGKKR